MGQSDPEGDYYDDNCCPCFQTKTKIIYRDRILFRDRQDGKVIKLSKDLMGVANELTGTDLKSNSSETTSEWNNSNPDHFEITIRYENVEAKFKVKKKYNVSKVISKFIEHEKPEKAKGILLRDGSALNGTDILEELGISENETLELI